MGQTKEIKLRKGQAKKDRGVQQSHTNGYIRHETKRGHTTERDSI
jgi:hypothetical protein